jgi:high-affinity Fe2+/Pb2+ permease
VENLKDDMKKVNDSISWLVKIILGAVVAALLGVVLVKGGMVPR